MESIASYNCFLLLCLMLSKNFFTSVNSLFKEYTPNVNFVVFLFLPDDSDMIFSLDEDHVENNAISDNVTRTCVNPTILNAAAVQKPRPRSPLRLKSFTTHRRKHVRKQILF